MKKIMTRWVVVMVIMCLPVLVSAQSYHRLSAGDFGGTPPAENGDIAFTNCHVDFTYQVITHGGSYDITFNVQLTMDHDKSYIRFGNVKSREQLQEILRHEQGHYNLAYLLKCEAYKVLSSHRYTANYHYEIARLYNQVEAKYQKLNADYESMTEHMLNAGNQERWNAWFSTQIDNVSLASTN